MKTVEKYVFSSFLASFALAALVFTFVLTIGILAQIVGYILDGVSMKLVGKFALVSFPETLQWTVPLSLMVSSLLVFSRLSADGEIAAMRACGVNMLSVMRWPAFFGLACTVLGAWVNNEIVPRGHEVRRKLKSAVTVDTGLVVLEPGVWIDDFPKAKLYFSRREGAWLYDLIVMDYSNPKIDRMIRASKALVASEGRDIVLDLYSMTVDPLDETHPGMARIGRYTYTVKDALKESSYKKKYKDMRFGELAAWIADSADREKSVSSKLAGNGRQAAADAAAKGLRKEMRRARSKAKTELSKRFVYAAASLCFVLVGMPLGIRAQRRESTVGMAVSLGVAMLYYLFVLFMISLQKNSSVHPEFLIWLPVAATFAVAAYFTRRNL